MTQYLAGEVSMKIETKKSVSEILSDQIGWGWIKYIPLNQIGGERYFLWGQIWREWVKYWDKGNRKCAGRRWQPLAAWAWPPNITHRHHWIRVKTVNVVKTVKTKSYLNKNKNSPTMHWNQDCKYWKNHPGGLARFNHLKPIKSHLHRRVFAHFTITVVFWPQ